VRSECRPNSRPFEPGSADHSTSEIQVRDPLAVRSAAERRVSASSAATCAVTSAHPASARWETNPNVIDVSSSAKASGSAVSSTVPAACHRLNVIYIANPAFVRDPRLVRVHRVANGLPRALNNAATAALMAAAAAGRPARTWSTMPAPSRPPPRSRRTEGECPIYERTARDHRELPTRERRALPERDQTALPATDP
jgi:hypothetical protein